MVVPQRRYSRDAAHQHQLGVAAGNEQQQIGKCEAVGQARRQGVALQMVDRVERLSGGARQRLARHQADDETADEAGSRGCGDRVDIRQLAAALRQRLADQPVEDLDMGARGDFRHDAAEGGVFLELRADHVGDDPAATVIPALDHGGGGLVAARLDAEDLQRSCDRTGGAFHVSLMIAMRCKGDYLRSR